MANTMSTQLAQSYLSQFDVSLSVSAMSKLSQFSFLQQLGYAGQQGSTVKDFHGLEDFYQMMNTYSSTNQILKAAWSTIEPVVRKNAFATALTYTDPQLGQVGALFQSIPSFGQVFSVSEENLANPDQIKQAAAPFQT